MNTMVAYITFGLAVLGAVLGVLNTWNDLDKKRLKLKVVPAHAIPWGGADARLRVAIAVTNLSSFPVTIDEVGFLLKGRKGRMLIMEPVVADGGSWPRRLEPRTSLSLYAGLPERTSGHPIVAAFVGTQCGNVIRGRSPALKQIAKQVGW